MPFPGLVTACQFLTTAFVVWFLGKLGKIDVESLRRDKLMQMAPINVVFYLAIFTNGQVLKYATVETFIAFRSLTPLLVCLLDTIVRGEPPPSRRTLGCLTAIALGAASCRRRAERRSVRRAMLARPRTRRGGAAAIHVDSPRAGRGAAAWIFL